MRRVIIFLVLIVPLAACSSSAKTAATTTTVATGTPASSSPTAPATGPVTAPPTAPPAVSTPPLAISVFVLGVNLHAHTITVDPIAFLTGAAAKAAFKHDHPGAQEGPPNDYYISNPKVDRVELKFPPTATVRLVQVGGASHTQPVAVPQSALVGYPTLSRRPFVITTAAGSVLKLVETFVP